MNAREIAEKLTEAQRRLMLDERARGLLSPLGLQVRAILQSEQGR